ncbi:uncharacterized protein LY89DRAFT_444467 [Mollisia scopiformis]|uniref:Uncharacterized protein n=1 Tax=Mollisia scopiformis TaxID=149040 RepID=A0A194XJS8_MOLSC|nr:uncharacterized protein LY89DRAFT_444467 [Mollisia scopiformis]KUJ20480.1 hypothetical protein LY89DRAFT_444467 [Mollisia scopiformis]
MPAGLLRRRSFKRCQPVARWTVEVFRESATIIPCGSVSWLPASTFLFLSSTLSADPWWVILTFIKSVPLLIDGKQTVDELVNHGCSRRLFRENFPKSGRGVDICEHSTPFGSRTGFQLHSQCQVLRQGKSS